MKFQYPAGTTLITAQFLLGKDSLFQSGNFGICQCNLLRLLQRYEQRLLALTENASEHCIYAIGPLCSAVVENELIVRSFDSAVYKFFRGKHYFADVGTARILQCRFPCDFHINISAVVDDLARLCVDLVAVTRQKKKQPDGLFLFCLVAE